MFNVVCIQYVRVSTGNVCTHYAHMQIIHSLFANAFFSDLFVGVYSHVMSLVCSCCQRKGKDQWIFLARVKHDRHNESLS